MTSNLIKRAEEIKKNLDIPKLNQGGIKRVNYNYKIFSYPPFFSFLSSKNLKNPLASVNLENKPRLYLHLPFCKSKCPYCPFLSVCSDKSEISNYLNAIKMEINLLFKEIEQEIEFSTIYFGGGTPTYLESEQIVDLFDFLKNKFHITKNTKIVSIEATPESLLGKEGKDKLINLRAAGVNRLSIGIQCSDPKILKLIGRCADQRKIKQSIANAQECGFKNTNIDLMFGLPMQTLESWESTLNFTKNLNPPSVHIHQYVLRPIVTSKFYSLYCHTFPSDEDNLCMNIMAHEFFHDNNYKEIHTNHFVLPQKYLLYMKGIKLEGLENSRNIIAVGASARSYIKPYFYRNSGSINEYLYRISKGKLPITHVMRLSKKEQMRRVLIAGLRTRIDKRAFKKEFGEDVEKFRRIFSKFSDLDLVKESKNYITLTKKGRLFTNEMCTKLFNLELKARLRIENFFMYSNAKMVNINNWGSSIFGYRFKGR